jgi:hypothetical protein
LADLADAALSDSRRLPAELRLRFSSSSSGTRVTGFRTAPECGV